MHLAGRYIIFAGVAVSGISGLYFLSLLAGVPVIATALLAVVMLFFLFKWMMKEATTEEAGGYSVWALAFLIAGMGIMTATAARIALKHGGWDAWGIWNLHAKYMADPEHWRLLFMNTANAHPDYPLCLPAFTGFFMRLCGGSIIIPFAISLFITLCIPVLIYALLARKNIIIAMTALFFFSRDTFYIERGVSQYADTLLAFFFLCAFVCTDHVEKGRRYVLLSALCLASCAWVKNEGIMLALLFLLFYARIFFTGGGLKYTAIGLFAPVAMVVIQKAALYGSNDLVAGSKPPLAAILDESRWAMIWESFTRNLDEKFYYIKICMYIYALACVLRRKLPGRAMLLLLTCTVAYMIVYIYTPRDLNWHLITSQDRVMHQLMPAFIYVLARAADIKPLIFKQQFA